MSHSPLATWAAAKWFHDHWPDNYRYIHFPYWLPPGAGLRPGVSSARHPAARHHEEVLPAAGQGEEDGEAGSSQDGPHPLLRQVHGRALAPWYAGYTVQLLSVLYSVTSK